MMQFQQSVKYYNPIYSVIGKCEKFFPIIATTAVGGMIAGTVSVSVVYGVAAGFTLGSIDLTANYFGIYDRPYLTSATLGAGVLSRLVLPYHIAPIAGFIVGLFVPTGILNDHLDKAVAPISGALHGYSYAGHYGAAAGFVAGIIDESLNSFNISSKYYITTIVKDVTISNLMLPIIPNVIIFLPAKLGRVRNVLSSVTKYLVETKYVKEFLGIAYGTYEAYRADKPQKWAPIKLAKDIHKTYADMMDEKQLQKIIDNQAISIVTTALITQNFVIGLAAHYQGTNSCFEAFESDSDVAWRNFKQEFKDFALFLPAYVGGIVTTNIINNFFASKLRYIIADTFTHKLTEEETILKLINSNNGNNTDANTLIKRKYEDVTSLTVQGTNLLSDALSSIVKGMFAINYLVSVNAQNILIYFMCYSTVTNSLSHWLSMNAGSYNVEITKLTDQKTSLEEYLRVNADSIIQRKSNEFLKAQLFKIDHDLRTVDGEKATWKMLHDTWAAAQYITNFLVRYLITAYHLHAKTIEFCVRFKVSFMVGDVYPMIAWSGIHAGEILRIKQAIDRLNELKIRVANDTIDSKILPTYVYKKSETYQICFDNLTVGVGDKTLMHIDHICVNESVTVVTGESHSGKSTLLKLVHGIQHSAAWGNGIITFYTKDGKHPNVIMASQHYNMPPYVTLLELITLKPHDEAIHRKDQIESLIIEMGIDFDTKKYNSSLISLLNDKKDWNQYITSGGARKKIMALWIILQDPDIAILDEIFVSIDSDAIQELKKMFMKYLPNTKFLIVDHEALAHNSDGFYRQNLHVENKTATITHYDQNTESSTESFKDSHDVCFMPGITPISDNPFFDF